MKRQFIAGAVCPRCGEQDKIVVVSDPEQRYRECVRCGFHDHPPGLDPNAELPTRVTRASARRVALPAEPVNLDGLGVFSPASPDSETN